MDEGITCSYCGSERGEPCDQITDLDASETLVAECLRNGRRNPYRCRDCGFIYTGGRPLGIREARGLGKVTRLLQAGGRFSAKQMTYRLALGEQRLRSSRRLRRFRNRHVRESCFILGNGPSLGQMDLVSLNERYVFGSNQIYLLFDRVDLRLSYHVSTDPMAIQRGAYQFSKQAWPTFITWKSGRTYLRGHDHIHFIRIRDEGDDEESRMYPPLFTTDISKPVWDGGTVTYVALQIAFYMGFQRVYLIGVDHSFQKHAPGSPDPNHFDPRYARPSRLSLPPDVRAMEVAYRTAKAAYEKDGRQILDATVGGQLDIFEKVAFEEAVANSSPRMPAIDAVAD